MSVHPASVSRRPARRLTQGRERAGTEIDAIHSEGSQVFAGQQGQRFAQMASMTRRGRTL